MLIETHIETDNYWLEGFEPSINGLEIQIESGKFIEQVLVRDLESEELVIGYSVMEYPSFSFDVEADSDFDVVYDVYLLELPSLSGAQVNVDRTILGYDQIAVYEGEDTLKFTLMSFTVKPLTVDLIDTTMLVKKVAIRVE